MRVWMADPMAIVPECLQKVEDQAVPTDFPVGECRQNYAPYSTISTARQCGLEDDELLQQADDLDLKLEGG